MYLSAAELNDHNVYSALSESGPHRSILDIGCWDWRKTIEYARNAGADEIYGIEIVSEKAKEAKEMWVKTFSLIADSEKWPFENESLDCVISNQVIEHLSNVDHFISEATRVLRKWGILVTSTNNLSSWHNIGALIMWWAPFDLSNSSSKQSWIWNPVAIHKWETHGNGSSWCHKTIFTTRWLNEWFQLYWFKPVKHYGSWYYPLPSWLGKIFRKHSAFITLVNQKN